MSGVAAVARSGTGGLADAYRSGVARPGGDALTDRLGETLVDPLQAGAPTPAVEVPAPAPEPQVYDPEGMGAGDGVDRKATAVTDTVDFRGHGGSVGGRGLITVMGAEGGVATTKNRGDVTKTHTESATASLLGTTRSSIHAEDSRDTKYANRDVKSTSLLDRATGGVKSTRTRTTAFEDEDGYKSVTGEVTKTRGTSLVDKVKGRPRETTTATKDLPTAPSRNPLAAKPDAKKATDEAGVRQVLGRTTLAKAMGTMQFGGVGDESGVDLDGFRDGHENEAGFIDGASGVQEVPGGQVASARGYVGPRVAGSTLVENRDTDAQGNARVSRAGASGEAFLGARGTAVASVQHTEKGKMASAGAQGEIGAALEGVAGATSQTKLGERMAAQAGAQVAGKAFAGVKGSAEAVASHGAMDAKAGAQAQAMAGVEASGSAGAKAGIDGAGFTLAGAQAKAEGKGMAGAEANAGGEVSASPLAVGAKGQAAGFAGARADGSASAGVSLGGADTDVAAKGEALAGAEAKAAGNASVGLAGANLEGNASAFAGAKAGGEARFEIGAGGLNFAVIGVNGEVSAGAGAYAGGNISASLTQLGISGKAGAAVGVGAGAGALFNVDPSFPVRLTLDKLAENKVIPTSDLGDLIGGAASLVYKPVVGAVKAATAPVFKDLQPDVAAPDGMASERRMLAPSEPRAAGPTEPVRLNEMLAKSSPKEREALAKSQGAVHDQLAGTAPALVDQIRSVLGAGGAMYSNLLSLMTGAFAASKEATEKAMASAGALIAVGIEQAKGVAAELGNAGKAVVASINQLVATDPKTLLDGGWEKVIDDGVERVRAFSRDVKARIHAIIERVRAAVAAVADKAVDAAVAPIKSMIGSLGRTVGSFAGTVTQAGLSMIRRLREVLVGAERGVPVPGMDGVLALPVEVSPTLDVTTRPVEEFASFGPRSIESGFGTAVDFIAGVLKDVLGTRAGGLLGGLASAASFVTGVMLDAPVKLAEGAAATAKPVIRLAIEIVRRAIEAAKAVAAAAAKVANAVKSAAASAWNWFTGLFRR